MITAKQIEEERVNGRAALVETEALELVSCVKQNVTHDRVHNRLLRTKNINKPHRFDAHYQLPGGSLTEKEIIDGASKRLEEYLYSFTDRTDYVWHYRESGGYIDMSLSVRPKPVADNERPPTLVQAAEKPFYVRAMLVCEEIMTNASQSVNTLFEKR